MPVDDDIAAFSDIFRKYYPDLCVYAFSLLNHKANAEDAVQQVFSYELSKHSFSTMQHSLSDYLYTCVHHHCLRMLAENRREKGTSPADLAQNNTDQSLKMFNAGAGPK